MKRCLKTSCQGIRSGHVLEYEKVVGDSIGENQGVLEVGLNTINDGLVV